MQAEVVTQAEYARHRGVSKQAISKQVAKGKIPVLPNGKIDKAAADLALGNSIERVDAEEAEQEARPRGAPATGGLTQAKTVTEVYKARLAELEYGRETGKYVEAAGIADASAACGETIVRIVRTISTKAEVVGAAMTKDGVAGVRAALKAIEQELLQRISDAFSKMAADAAAGMSVNEGHHDQ